MSLSTTPAPARTDGPAATHVAPGRRPASTRLVRAGGLAVTTGSLAWAAGILAFGFNPAPGWQGTLYDASSLLFQLGLVALVYVQLRTGATGAGKLARFFLHFEHVLLGLAIVSTLTWMFAREFEDEAWFLALDAFWPLSMIGMFFLGIRIAIAGRWTGAARFWPLGAESWAPVNIPVAQIAAGAASFTGAAHLVFGYAGLGVVLMLRPELTGARD